MSIGPFATVPPSSVAFAAVAYALGLRDAPVTDPDLVRVLPQLAWMILLLGPGSQEQSLF